MPDTKEAMMGMAAEKIMGDTMDWGGLFFALDDPSAEPLCLYDAAERIAATSPSYRQMFPQPEQTRLHRRLSGVIDCQHPQTGRWMRRSTEALEGGFRLERWEDVTQDYVAAERNALLAQTAASGLRFSILRGDADGAITLIEPSWFHTWFNLPLSDLAELGRHGARAGLWRRLAPALADPFAAPAGADVLELPVTLPLFDGTCLRFAEASACDQTAMVIADVGSLGLASSTALHALVKLEAELPRLFCI
ncbi:MAG: hypothetical protein ACT7A5_14510 [Ferrovibrionaceae bacterium]